MFAEPVPIGAGPVEFVHKRIIGAIGGFVSGGPLGAVAGFAGGGRTQGQRARDARAQFTGADRGIGLGLTQGCPSGHVFRNGRCERTGFGGFAERAIPFGQTGTLADTAGEAVAGGFNMPAFVPQVVGNISRLDGSSGPILRCPRGTVLATDNLCYAKGTKGLAAHRKWRPGRPPFLPRRDLAALDRVASLRKNKTLKGRMKALNLC